VGWSRKYSWNGPAKAKLWLKKQMFAQLVLSHLPLLLAVDIALLSLFWRLFPEILFLGLVIGLGPGIGLVISVG